MKMLLSRAYPQHPLTITLKARPSQKSTNVEGITDQKTEVMKLKRNEHQRTSLYRHDDTSVDSSNFKSNVGNPADVNHVAADLNGLVTLFIVGVRLLQATVGISELGPFAK